MFTAVFTALVILVAALLITRHYYLGKIEKLNLAQERKNNLDFRRGYEEGWASARRYIDQKKRYDKIAKIN